jgi:hypothetical protein
VNPEEAQQSQTQRRKGAENNRALRLPAAVSKAKQRPTTPASVTVQAEMNTVNNNL